jgi:hypothetical protein
MNKKRQNLLGYTIMFVDFFLDGIIRVFTLSFFTRKFLIRGYFSGLRMGLIKFIFHIRDK